MADGGEASLESPLEAWRRRPGRGGGWLVVSAWGHRLLLDEDDGHGGFLAEGVGVEQPLDLVLVLDLVFPALLVLTGGGG